MKNPLVSFLFLSLFLSILLTSPCEVAPVYGSAITVVKVEPAIVVLGKHQHNCVGENFTVAVNVYNLPEGGDGLWGLDIRLRWNTTFIEYVDHTVKIPVETYPDGVLHEPVMKINDDVNTAEGTYLIVYSSMLPASPFGGYGTIFEMTFAINYQPLEPEPDVDFLIKIVYSYLADTGCTKGIIHDLEHCYVTICARRSPDINRDGIVDIYDIVIAADAYESHLGDTHWNQLADLAPQWEIINIYDLVTCACHYGETYP